MSEPAGPVQELDVLVVGAGFGGMYALHRLRGRSYEEPDEQHSQARGRDKQRVQRIPG